MKNKKRTLIGVSTLLIVVGGWYLLAINEPAVESVSTQQGISKEKQEFKKTNQELISQSLAEYIHMPDANAEIIESVEKIRVFQNLKTAEFSYYGKIIDQHGGSVVGVKVKGYYTYYPLIPNGDFSSSTKDIEMTTNDQGVFLFTKHKGRSISITSFEKEGYEFEGNRTYIFSRGGVKMLKSIGDPDKPVIFHAWKKTEAEPLIHNEILIGFSPDGKKYAVDLITPKKVVNGDSGDIIISFNRSINAKFNEGYDWNVTLAAIGGGVIETNDLFMNEAPENGYESVWKLEIDKHDLNYQRNARRKFYLKSRNGKVYGRLEFEFIPLYNKDSVIDAKWWLNINGSRNLQYDPKKQIWPQ